VAKSIPLTDRYMTAQIHRLVQAVQ
jgi:hypothetical protein